MMKILTNHKIPDQQPCYSVDLRTSDRSGTRWSGPLPALGPGRYGFHLVFDTSRYPLRQHLCYMRPRNSVADTESQPRRFVDMRFQPEPPGIPVGPWPGWRGIPAMPEIRLQIGDRIIQGRFNFWGDEFETGQCRVFVLVAVQDERDFTLIWTDERLQPISMQIYPSAKRRAASIPVELKPELKSTYPRLLFSAAMLEELRARKDGSHRSIWHSIEQLMSNWQLEFVLSSESKTLPGPERLHDLDRVILASFYALMIPKPEPIAQAKTTLRNFINLVLRPDYEPMQIDTQAGECLFTLCLGYDWLQPWLTEAEREQIRSDLFLVAERVWAHLGYEREDYAQAHFLGCSHGLLAFAFLFWHEHPCAAEWADFLRGAFAAVIEMLPADGFYPHGINLWIYEHTFLLHYLELFRYCAGVDLWADSAYWANASRFRRAALSPDARLGITFGDPQYRVGGDTWMHYLIATRTGSQAAQWLGTRLAEVQTAGVDFRSVPARRRVWEYLYFNPDVKVIDEDHKISNFKDGGQIFWRVNSGATETLLTFRAGAPLGQQRYAAGEWSGYGHSDPGNGGFLLAQASAFLICGPGPVYRRDTSLHNTLTFDGRGQIGDGLPWAPEFVPQHRFARIIQSHQDEDTAWIEADLAPAYLDHLGVQCLVRRLRFILPHLVLVQDRIQLAATREIQWNLHTYGKIEAMSADAPIRLKITDGDSSLQLICLRPEAMSWRTGRTEFVPAYPHAGERDRFVQLYCRGGQAELLFLLALGNIKLDWQMQRRRTGTANWQLYLSVNGKELEIKDL